MDKISSAIERTLPNIFEHEYVFETCILDHDQVQPGLRHHSSTEHGSFNINLC